MADDFFISHFVLTKWYKFGSFEFVLLVLCSCKRYHFGEKMQSRPLPDQEW
jgi:hypothetical protein